MKFFFFIVIAGEKAVFYVGNVSTGAKNKKNSLIRAFIPKKITLIRSITKTKYLTVNKNNLFAKL